MTPLIGKAAPDFALFDQDGKLHKLSDYLGSWLLIYFYPKDDTPGCTQEACTIRDAMPNFSELGISVLGVSADSAKKHAAFANKYSLPFPLLADPEHIMLDAYGVWREKKFMGRTYMGIARTSFLISPEGTIAKVYEAVKPKLHAGEVLENVGTLSSTH